MSKFYKQPDMGICQIYRYNDFIKRGSFFAKTFGIGCIVQLLQLTFPFKLCTTLNAHKIINMCYIKNILDQTKENKRQELINFQTTRHIAFVV